MNREQIIEMAREAGVMKLDDPPNIPFMYRFAALAYAAGQRDMREKAALVCFVAGAHDCADAIHALPIEGEKK